MKNLLLSICCFGILLCQGQEVQKIVSQTKAFNADTIIHKIKTPDAPFLKLAGVRFAKKTFDEVLKDTVVQVFYNSHKTPENQPAFFIDSVFMGGNLNTYLEPNNISAINIVEGQTIKNSATYDSQVYITTKEKTSSHFDLRSLNQIKSIYLHPSDKNCIYQVDGKIITENPDTYYVAKNYIFRIIVSKLIVPDKLSHQNLEFDVINILLKTKENFEASNNIILRGNNDNFTTSKINASFP